MRIGLDTYTILDRDLDAEQTLALVHDRGLDGIQFVRATQIDPDLDATRLASIRDGALRRDLYLEVGMPSPNPLLETDRDQGGRSPEDHARGLIRHLDAAGRILTRNWEQYDGQHVVHLPKLMTPRELQEGHERAWKAVYSRRAIWKRLSKARVQIPIAIAANLGYRFYAHHLHTHYNCDWPQAGTASDLAGAR